MHCATRPALASAALAFLVACQGDRTLSPNVPPPFAAISDGAHASGNPDFFFLPPIVPDPSGDANFSAGAFNPDLLPVVDVCELNGDPSAGPVQCGATAFGPAAANLALPEEHYAVNWNTDASNGGAGLDVTKFYRIRVFASTGGTLLGFADVDPVGTGKELKNVQTGDVVGLVDGRTLPVKFRVEEGALCSPAGTATCSSETIVLAEGGSVVLEETGDRVDIPAQNSGQVITVTLELCDGIGVDVPTFGNCLSVTASPSLAAALSPRAIVSLCSLQPGALGLSEAQEDLVTLYRRDNGDVFALPHADDRCVPEIGQAQLPARSFVQAAWRAVGRALGNVFQPRPLHASTALLDVGEAGETPFFSDFQFALPAQMEALPGTTPQSAAPGAAVANPPGVFVSDAHGDAVQGATVHFAVTAGDGTITPLQVVSDEVGIARVTSWTLGDPGANTARASGFGIAGPEDGGPFMPDIFDEESETPIPTDQQQTVDVGTGEVVFNATAVGADLIVTQVTHAPPNPTDADLIDFGVIVQNVGTAPAGRFGIAVSTTGAGIPGETVTVPGLDPGDESLEPGESSIRCCWHLHRPAGTFTQTATVDVHNEVAESNETNNTLSETYAVTAVVYTGAVTDATGDVPEGENDLASASATVAEGKLTLRVNFAGTRASTSYVTFTLDVDRNATTGFPGINAGNDDSDLMGVEYLISMGQDVSANVGISWYNGTGFVTVPNSIPITFVGDAMEATIPLSMLLGNKDGKVNYKLTLQRQLSAIPSFTGIFDYLPEIGASPGTVAPPIP